MGIPTFDVDVEIISKLNDYPGSDDGLSTAAFRAKFDLAAKLIKEYINTVLLPNINMTMDVDALVAGVQKQMGVVFSVDLANYFEKVIQSGDYVLNSGAKFNAVKVSDTMIRIYGGEAVIQGHLVILNPEEPISITIPAGTYGTNRNDLICLRFTRTEDGTETGSIAHLAGETTQSGGVDPVYRQDNLNVVAPAVRDFPLYRISMRNTTAVLEPLFVPADGVVDLMADKVISKLSYWDGGDY